MHVSLSSELKKMVKDRVDNGICRSASEVIRAALHKFFHIGEDDDISPEEADRIREIVAPRLDAVKNGTAKVHDFDQTCDELNKEIFG